MSSYQNGYEWKGTDQSSGNKQSKTKRKKKVNVFNIVLYCIAGALILTGIIILVNEFVLFTNDETEGLISEDEYNEVYAEIEPIEPLATPVDQYDNIPVQFHFIDQKASCDIYPTGKEADGSMGTVPSAADVTWLSCKPYVEPGQVGNAVISGHNLWKGKAGSFSLLKKINIGETVAVTFDKGFTRYFEVVKRYECKYNDPLPMKTEGVDEPILTLITCKGDWSDHLGQSKTRVVVICKPIKK